MRAYRPNEMMDKSQVSDLINYTCRQWRLVVNTVFRVRADLIRHQLKWIWFVAVALVLGLSAPLICIYIHIHTLIVMNGNLFSFQRLSARHFSSMYAYKEMLWRGPLWHRSLVNFLDQFNFKGETNNFFPVVVAVTYSQVSIQFWLASVRICLNYITYFVTQCVLFAYTVCLCVNFEFVMEWSGPTTSSDACQCVCFASVWNGFSTGAHSGRWCAWATRRLTHQMCVYCLYNNNNSVDSAHKLVLLCVDTILPSHCQAVRREVVQMYAMPYYIKDTDRI